MAKLKNKGLDLWKESKTLMKIDTSKDSLVGESLGSKSKSGSLFIDENEDPWTALPKHLRNKKKLTYIRIHRSV